MLYLTLTALLSCAPAEISSDEPVDLTVDLAPPTAGYQVVTTPAVVAPYEEALICSVLRIEGGEEGDLLWVDTIESLSSDTTHHFNVLFGEYSFFDAFLGDGAAEEQLGAAVGTYDCAELGDLMETSYTLFPSDRSNQRITFPEGVGMPLAAPMVLVVEHHFINTTDQPVEINGALNFYLTDPDDVTDVVSLIFTDINDLEVPPGAQKVEARTCVIDREVEVALVSTHNHEWTDCATLNRYDGATGTIEPEPFFVNKSWDQPPILHFERGSWSMSPGDGIHWACHFDNSKEETLLNDGTGAGEMCVFAAVTYPAPLGVAEVEEIFAARDLSGALALLDNLITDCDSYADDAASPWAVGEVSYDETESACADLPQTESNELDR